MIKKLIALAVVVGFLVFCYCTAEYKLGCGVCLGLTIAPFICLKKTND